MSRARQRLLALSLSTLLALGAGWLGWRWLRERRGADLDLAVVDEALVEELSTEARERPGRVGAGRPVDNRFVPDEERAGQLFRLSHTFYAYDEQAIHWHVPNIDHEFEWAEHPDGKWRKRTNSLGFRRDGELQADPEFRAIVVGDSHVDGICNNAETAPLVLETLLAERHPGRRIEVLNAAKGAYSFYEYLLLLEKFLPLEPDLFVVAPFAGNDFSETLLLHYIFAGEPRPGPRAQYQALLARAIEAEPTALGQCYSSLNYFRSRPAQRQVAVAAARDVADEIARLCREHDVDLVFALFPGPCEVQGLAAPPEKLEHCRELLELPPDCADTLTHLGDRFLGALEKRGIPYVDVRPAFRAAEERLYWSRDLHLNIAGHRLLAEALLPFAERSLERRLAR